MNTETHEKEYGWSAVLKKFPDYKHHEFPRWFHIVAREYGRNGCRASEWPCFKEDSSATISCDPRWDGLLDHWGTTGDMLIAMPHGDWSKQANAFADVLGLERGPGFGEQSPYFPGAPLYCYTVSPRRSGALDIVNGKKAIKEKYPDWSNEVLPKGIMPKVMEHIGAAAEADDNMNYLGLPARCWRMEEKKYAMIRWHEWPDLFRRWGRHSHGHTLSAMPIHDVREQAERFAEVTGMYIASEPGAPGTWGFGTHQFDFKRKYPL